MDFFAIALGSSALVACILYVAVAPRPARPSDVIRGRLESLLHGEGPGGAAVTLDLWEGAGPATIWERAAKFFLGDATPTERDTPLRRVLHQAGFWGERPFQILLGVRVVLSIALAAYFFFMLGMAHSPTLKVAAGVVAGAAGGWGLPLFVVKRWAFIRQRDIEEAFPDALDLLVVCVEAGLGIDASLVRVAEEQSAQGLAIGHELLLATREVRAGVPRREALERMANRLESESVRSCAGYLIRTEELGGSIGRSLKIYAETMREKRMHKAQETARKTVIRLLFPLALLILPSLFLVVTAPVIVNIVSFVQSTGGAPPPQ